MLNLHTKEEKIQAFIRHVLVDEYFIFFNATAEKSNKILVLELGYELCFIFNSSHPCPDLFESLLM